MYTNIPSARNTSTIPSPTPPLSGSSSSKSNCPPTYQDGQSTGGGSGSTGSGSSTSCWAMSRSTMTIAILLVPFVSLLSSMIQVLHAHAHANNNMGENFIVPEYIFNSAFETELYQANIQEPYRNLPCMPRKLHISQGSDSTINNKVSMTISFTLDREHCAYAVPKVLYGKGPFRHDESHPDDTERVNFTYASPKLPGETYTSDWIYHVTLKNLEVGLKQYWYKILVDDYYDPHQHHRPQSPSHRLYDTTSAAAATAADAASITSPIRWFFLRGRKHHVGETPTYTFQTPPLPRSPTNIALVGDIGQTENSTKTMNHILTARNAPIPHPVSAVIIAGDLSYSDTEPLRWERWLDVMEPLLRTTPMQTAAGNHEIECDNVTHSIFVPYENYFRNPNRLGPADMLPIDDDYRKTLFSCNGPSEFLGHYNYGNAFYAFTHGLVKIVVLNSYTDTKIGSIQYKWLEQELPTIDRTVTPWLLVVFHCPLQTTFLGHESGINSVMMLENMEPLFVKHHVNLVLSGHDHAFLRTHPMVGGKLDLSGKGPVYLTLGAGGNREEHTAGYIHDIPEPWVAKRDNYEYGYGNLFVANDTHAHFTWVRDGTTTQGVQDDVWLTNQFFSKPIDASPY